MSNLPPGYVPITPEDKVVQADWLCYSQIGKHWVPPFRFVDDLVIGWPHIQFCKPALMDHIGDANKMVTELEKLRAENERLKRGIAKVITKLSFYDEETGTAFDSCNMLRHLLAYEEKQ